LYVKAPQSKVKRPIKELKSFKRNTLAPGASKTVTFTLPASELAYWDLRKNGFVVEPGMYNVMVGKSSTDIQLIGNLTVVK